MLDRADAASAAGTAASSVDPTTMGTTVSSDLNMLLTELTVDCEAHSGFPPSSVVT